MPRGPRTLIDGGTYHVMARGNNGQVLFHADHDFQRYLRLLLAQIRAHRLQLFHYALMPDHVHLVLRIEAAKSLSKAMHSLSLTYSHYYRKRHRYTGHLWQGRFKSAAIHDDSYLLECGRYVELNPVRAGLADHPRRYPWTSYRTYADGLDNPLLAFAEHPRYPTLGRSDEERRAAYRECIEDRLEEKRLMGADAGPQAARRGDLRVRGVLGLVALSAGRPRKWTLADSGRR